MKIFIVVNKKRCNKILLNLINREYYLEVMKRNKNHFIKKTRQSRLFKSKNIKIFIKKNIKNCYDREDLIYYKKNLNYYRRTILVLGKIEKQNKLFYFFRKGYTASDEKRR